MDRVHVVGVSDVPVCLPNNVFVLVICRLFMGVGFPPSGGWEVHLSCFSGLSPAWAIVGCLRLLDLCRLCRCF